MRILNVVSSINPNLGGVSQAVMTINKGFNDLGLDSEIISLDDNGDFKIKNNKTVFFLGPRKSPWQYSAKLKIWLRDNLKNYNIVIIHGLWLYHSYEVHRQWEKLPKDQRKLVKLFVIPHGMLDSYFQNDNQRKLKAIRNNIYWQVFEKKILNAVDGVIFTTKDEERNSINTFPAFNPRKIGVINLGLENPPAFKEEMKESILKLCPSLKWNNYILYLGRIHPKKGVDILVDCFKNLQIDTQLLIAGPGFETDFGEEIQNQIINDNRILHLNMLSGMAKWGAFYGAKAFILPSHQENFGIAVVEALSCNIPVLISNKVNIFEDIETFKAGIVMPDTKEGIREMLKNWITLSPSNVRLLGNNAGTLFEKKYNYKTAAGNLLRFCENNLS